MGERTTQQAITTQHETSGKAGMAGHRGNFQESGRALCGGGGWPGKCKACKGGG